MMNLSDTSELLARIAAFDRRTTGQADIHAWQAVLEDLTLPECIDAVVAHFRESTDWCMPAHIRQHVQKAKAQRREQIERSSPMDAIVGAPGVPLPKRLKEEILDEIDRRRQQREERRAAEERAKTQALEDERVRQQRALTEAIAEQEHVAESQIMPS